MPPAVGVQIFNWICELMSTATLVFGALMMYSRREQLYEPDLSLFRVRRCSFCPLHFLCCSNRAFAATLGSGTACGQTALEAPRPNEAALPGPCPGASPPLAAVLRGNVDWLLRVCCHSGPGRPHRHRSQPCPRLLPTPRPLAAAHPRCAPVHCTARSAGCHTPYLSHEHPFPLACSEPQAMAPPSGTTPGSPSQPASVGAPSPAACTRPSSS